MSDARKCKKNILLLNIIINQCSHTCRYSYPSIFIIYQTVPTIILGSLALIAYVDNKGLFCSSQFVQESMRNPTTFCTITGMVLERCKVAYCQQLSHVRDIVVHKLTSSWFCTYRHSSLLHHNTANSPVVFSCDNNVLGSLLAHPSQHGTSHSQENRTAHNCSMCSSRSTSYTCVHHPLYSSRGLYYNKISTYPLCC